MFYPRQSISLYVSIINSIYASFSSALLSLLFTSHWTILKLWHDFRAHRMNLLTTSTKLFCLIFFFSSLTSMLRNSMPQWCINVFIQSASLFWGPQQCTRHGGVQACVFVCVCVRTCICNYIWSPRSRGPCWVDQIRYHVFVKGRQMEEEEEEKRGEGCTVWW